MKHGNELTKTESRRLCLFLLNAVVVMGIAIGAAITVMHKGHATESIWLHQFIAPIYSGNTILDVFKNTFLSSAFYMLAVFLLGFLSCGQPVGIALLIYRGVGIGVSVSQMYIFYGINSLPAVLVLTLPKSLVLAFIASLGVREMLKISSIQFEFLFKDKLPEEKMQKTVKLYCIKFLVLILSVLLVSVIDAAVNYFFINLLNH